MKTYTHRFTIAAPLAAVADFHRRPASMGQITPPPIIARVHSAPAIFSEGDEMSFTLWMGPLPLRWRAQFAEVGPNGFIDRQIAGPFQRWEHRHSFRALDAGHTEVEDSITAEFKRHPFWRLVGMGMWLGMPLLFAFRGWKTRRLLAAK